MSSQMSSSTTVSQTTTTTIPCQVLITTVLNEVWTDVFCQFSHNNTTSSLINNKLEFQFYRLETVKGSSSFNNKHTPETQQVNMFFINNSNINTIIKDPDNLSLLIDSKSNFHQSNGYFTIKFNTISDFWMIIKLLEPFKHIHWSFRTSEQDKKYLYS